MLPPATRAALGGGRDLPEIHYGWLFHPFDPAFAGFVSSGVLTAYNRIIDRLYRVHPFFGHLGCRIALGRTYYEETIRARQDAAWLVATAHDTTRLMEGIEDSHEGNPAGFSRGGRFLTVSFLDELMQIFFLEEQIDIRGLRTVMEIGSGIGLKASAYLKLNRDLTYIIVDIPPALYVAQQYLSAVHGNVLPYHEVKKLLSEGKRVDFRKYRAVCIAPWMLDSLSDLTCDLFINVGSFQEMEPWLVENYIKTVKRCRPQWVYLSELREGHITAEEGKLGVLKQTKYGDYTRLFGPEYRVLQERDMTRTLLVSDKSFDLVLSRGSP